MTIAIGLLEWKEKRLKPATGKRIALRVSNNAPYTEILSKAVKKWKAYHTDLYIEDEESSLYFENVKQAQFIPETVEFFTLSKYQEEIGKDYKRITSQRVTNQLIYFRVNKLLFFFVLQVF